MTNILTAAEASNVLRCETTDALMLNLLPAVDNYIRTATGHDWTADSPIVETAKSAARMLLVMWHENPSMSVSGNSALNFGLSAALAQLEAQALRYKTFEGEEAAGAVDLHGACVGDTVSALIGVVGATGDQHALFEDVITVKGQIQQLSTSDLSGKFYRAYLVPAESIV
jgi:hypothetical protein